VYKRQVEWFCYETITAQRVNASVYQPLRLVYVIKREPVSITCTVTVTSELRWEREVRYGILSQDVVEVINTGAS